MIKFSIPDYYGFYGLNLFLIDLMREQPDKFYDDIIIDSVYGSFPVFGMVEGIIQEEHHLKI